jgi:hypothetical protein
MSSVWLSPGFFRKSAQDICVRNQSCHFAVHSPGCRLCQYQSGSLDLLRTRLLPSNYSGNNHLQATPRAAGGPEPRMAQAELGRLPCWFEAVKLRMSSTKYALQRKVPNCWLTSHWQLSFEASNISWPRCSTTDAEFVAAKKMDIR